MSVDLLGGRMAFGGDYNPEQWTPDVWREDVRLMRQAGVTLVTLGVFAWSRIEPVRGEFDFAWLDDVLGLLHDGGIAVDLATPTAAPPPWLHREHPEILPVDENGRRWSPGGRLGWCPSSPVYRAEARRVVTALAEHLAGHPAIRLWHIGNEFGCGNGRCYCDVSAEAFRCWLAERYGSPAALNQAWGTAFWSQAVTTFEDVHPPRFAGADRNPSALLDFARFSSDELLAQVLTEKEVLTEFFPDVPKTTNFALNAFGQSAHYDRWVPHLDLVSNDHYTVAADPMRWQELAFSADRVRGLAGGEPWLLMEHSTSHVVYQPRNRAKAPGELAQDSLAHVARGSDGAMFFQWRASVRGSEQFHSAMLPHAGADTEVFREVTRLGALLGRLGPVVGTRVEPAPVAMIVDPQVYSAFEAFPLNVDVQPAEQALSLHRALLEQGVRVDVAPAGADLDGYRAVVVPTLYLVDDATAVAVEQVAARGGHVLISYLSGIVDDTAGVRLGGYPGAFRDLLGVRAEEFQPLQADESVRLDHGWTGSLWTERLQVLDAEVVAGYADGPLAGSPALTRRGLSGGGTAWYVSTRLDDAARAALVARFTETARIAPDPLWQPGLDVVRRGGFAFLANRGDRPLAVPVTGFDLVSETTVDGPLLLAAAQVAVVRLA
jgi:beta-galactosidase